MKSLYQLILVQFKSFFREPAIIFWAILFPIIMAWVLGLAFSKKGENLRTVFITSETVITKLEGEQVFASETGTPFRIRFIKANTEDAIRAIKRGVIALYIEPKGDSLVYHFDPSNPDAQLLHLIIERELSNAATTRASVMPLETKGTRYIDFLIPGLIGLGIMNSCLWGIGWNLIETRMKKLLRRMVATPMKKTVFLGALMITRVILGGIETLLLFAFAYFYFGTEITGSFVAFVIVFLAGVLAFSGIAILTASRTAKSEIGNGLINAVTLTMTILSGIFFNYHNFPDWAISFIQVLPLTILADSIRAIFIEGAGMQDVMKAIIVLSITGLVTFTLGLKVFKWY
jgi:ABC-type multidrug transport system permease subunit